MQHYWFKVNLKRLNLLDLLLNLFKMARREDCFREISWLQKRLPGKILNFNLKSMTLSQDLVQKNFWSRRDFE